MSWLSDLADGLGAYLADHGVGAWSPGGVYAATDTGIIVGLLPAQPAAAIAINAYPLTDSATGTESLVGVQLRFRGATRDPNAATDLADAAFTVLNGARHITLGGVPVSLVWRQASTPPAPDESGRHQVADTYHLHASRPPTVWRDDT